MVVHNPILERKHPEYGYIYNFKKDKEVRIYLHNNYQK